MTEASLVADFENVDAAGEESLASPPDRSALGSFRLPLT